MSQHAFNYVVDSANVGRFPDTWRPRLANRFYTQYKASGYAAAKHELIDNLNAIDGFRFDLASDDDSICSFAKARAAECFRVASLFKDKDIALTYMLKVAQRYDIDAPTGRNVTQQGQRIRLLNEHWWRRNLRRVTARNVEAAAINIGLVSRVAGLYVSDESVLRRRQQKQRNSRILSMLEAFNDNGDTFTLQDLSDLSVSNPKIKRMELMTRIAGFDAVAQTLGHAAEFYTLTAPSKYHARHHITGHEQKNYNGATPNETQHYLVTIWARIRAKLHRDGIRIYGFRVCEPHHDGTPHWHMLFFVEPANVPALRAIIKHYAMAEDGQEAGASKHRFTYTAIDRKKGSAVGYIAKYIAKNIDGFNVGDDYEAKAANAADTSERVDTWAATWGIRQFQQIGGQSVTLWRELRRAEVDRIENETLKAIASAADVGAWDNYTLLNGGVFGDVKRAAITMQGAIDTDTGEIRLNQYEELAAPKIVGFDYAGEQIATRQRVWVFKRKAPAVAPRSSVNNCTQLATIEKAAQIEIEKEVFREQRPPPSAPFCFGEKKSR